MIGAPLSALRRWRALRHWSRYDPQRPRLDCRGHANSIVLGPGVRLCNSRVLIRGNGNRLSVGGDCVIIGTIELYGDGNTITIGERSSLFEVFLAAHGGRAIRIGSDCAVGVGTDIRTSDSHPIMDAGGRRRNPDRDVEIGNRVWLPRHANVLRGARIGADSVIGVGAVVTGIIPPGSLAAGVPARVIADGISWRP